ncbi:hypothetical protein CEF21_08130 [Bacillus sp. FJAT-42376]|uniref:hypothetical protein n=1 Tax=Bacillus sp. FJAT-42376 TaxID=2014076 RepID=UPI000F4EEA92|nr:hypothetical protein [Bacillus sp. FJAT-42376]AZB44784.1 hypothetical protein CEF21_08130 [Bacillus sp. FJAT-42376]
MKAAYAKKKAAEWVQKHAGMEPWFKGAFFSGSAASLLDSDDLPIGSDVDVMIVTAEENEPLKLGKFLYSSVLIEVSYIPFHAFHSTEDVLSSYHLAHPFRTNTIIVDPTGELHRIQQEVEKRFDERTWVTRRCQDAEARIRNGLQTISPEAPFYDQLTSWLFAAGVTTHVLLTAALRNPTIRLRYLKVRDVLDEYKLKSFYPELLQLLGCWSLTGRQVQNHLNELAHVFDAAASVAKTPFFFSTDITEAARPIAIGGSADLIDAGNHREAMFWILATFARCHKILAADAPLAVQQQYTPAFQAAAADLGIVSYADLTNRSADVIRFLPALWTKAEIIMERNPDIREV